jgi:prepilin-type N-terminal cleavage/methylation domain-containing protein/prepilin-type processing-associated H-X9-DG protein
MKAQNAPNSPAKAFTLVELLVVIAIISILAGLLLPALENALDSSRSIHCMNNVKEICLIQFNYNDEYYPFITPGVMEGTSWNNWMVKHGWFPVREILYCPSNTENEVDRDYSINSGLNGHINRIDYFKNPSARVLHCDSWWYELWSQTYYLVRVYDINAGKDIYWHQGGASFGFFDGHVEHMQEGHVLSNSWDLFGS